MTDPPRRQALGAVKVQPGAAFLPSLAQVWKIRKIRKNQKEKENSEKKSARISTQSRMRVLGLMNFLGLLCIDKLTSCIILLNPNYGTCMILKC